MSIPAHGTEVVVDPGSNLIDQLTDQVAVLTTEAQILFDHIHRALPWKIDWTTPPSFQFQHDPMICFTPQFVGWTTDSTRLWHWGWENPSGFSPDAIRAASHVRSIGSQVEAANHPDAAIEALRTALPLDPQQRRNAGLAPRSEYGYVCAAMAVSGYPTPVFYRTRFGPDAHAWLVLSNPDQFSLPTPTAWATMQAISTAVSRGLVTNHRLAVRAYADRRPGLTMTDRGDHISIDMAAGTVLLTFDDSGRIRDIKDPTLESDDVQSVAIDGSSSYATPPVRSEPADRCSSEPVRNESAAEPNQEAQRRGFFGAFFGKNS